MAEPIIAVTSVLDTNDSELLSSIFTTWLSLPDPLEAPARLAGFQLTHETDDVSLYCHDAIDRASCFLHVRLNRMTLEQARQTLERLKDLCQESKVDARIDYVEEDEHGLELSEEFTIETESACFPEAGSVTRALGRVGAV